MAHSGLPDPEPVAILGCSNGPRRPGRPIGIRLSDRFSHVYLVGRTGVGKSTLMENIVRQDIRAGLGVCIIDPHGDTAEALRGEFAASPRVHYLDGARADWHLNPLEQIAGAPTDLVAAGIVETFKKLWTDGWGPRLEHLLRNVVLTLLAQPAPQLGLIPRLLADKDYRDPIVRTLRDPVLRSFWWDEYARYSPGFRAVVISPLQNKLGAVLADRRLRAILDVSRSDVALDTVMNRQGVLLVNLAKGQLGEGPASLLGSLLVSRIALLGLSRASQAEGDRPPFLLHLDEFHTFTTEMLATMLSELRKYRVGLVLAHQYLAQLDPQIRDAVLGNVGTTIVFRVGAQDAKFFASELAPTFESEDLLRLPNYNAYLKLLNGGEIVRPFSMRAMP